MIEFKTIEVKETNRWFSYDAPRWIRIIEFFIRVRICKQRSYLVDRWTVVEDEILETQHGLGDEAYEALIAAYTRSEMEIYRSQFEDRD